MTTDPIQLLLEKKQYQLALQFLATSLLHKPNDSKINFQCAEAYRCLGQYKEALKHYEVAQKHYFDHPYLYLLMAYTYYYLKDNENAALYIQKQLQQNKKNNKKTDWIEIDTIRLHANLLKEKNQLDEAQQLLEQAVQLYPKNFKLHLELAMVFLLQQKLPQALDCCHSASSLTQQDYEVWRCFSEIYNRSSEYQKEIECLDKALQLLPINHEKYLEFLETKVNALIKLNRKEEAIHKLHQYAFDMKNKNEYGLALKACDDILILDPQFKRALIYKSEIYWNTNLQAAKECLKIVLSMTPRDLITLFNLAACSRLLCQFEDAEIYHQIIFNNQFQNEYTLFEYSLYLYQAEKYNQALECLMMLIKDYPQAKNKKHISRLAADTCMKLDQVNDALKYYFQTLKQIQPSITDSEMWCKAGIFVQDHQNQVVAKQCFEQALMHNPDNEEAKKLLKEPEKEQQQDVGKKSDQSQNIPTASFVKAPPQEQQFVKPAKKPVTPSNNNNDNSDNQKPDQNEFSFI